MQLPHLASCVEVLADTGAQCAPGSQESEEVEQNLHIKIQLEVWLCNSHAVIAEAQENTDISLQPLHCLTPEGPAFPVELKLCLQPAFELAQLLGQQGPLQEVGAVPASPYLHGQANSVPER